MKRLPILLTFTLISVFSTGAYAAADIAADKLNQPQIALATEKHSGKLGKTFSMASTSDPAESVNARFKVGDRTYDRSIAYYTGFYGVYGWPGYYESHLRTEDVAYVGSHTHNPHERNKAYVFSYMYLVSIPVNGAAEVELPDNRNVLVFSATAEK